MSWKWFWNTETKYYDGQITRDTDWGGDASTENQPVSGGRVQEWLKNEINARVGYINRSMTKEEDGLYHVRGFSSEADYLEWTNDKENHAENVLIHFTIPDMTSTTASYVLNLVSGASNYIVSTDGKVVLPLRFVSVLFSPIDQSTTDSGENGVLTIQTRLNSSAGWGTRGTMPINSLSKDSSEFTMVDISEYLNNGEQQVRVIVRGETSESSTNYVTLTVVKTELNLTFANDWWNPIRTASITPSYYINGAVEKTLNIVVDKKRTFTTYLGTATYTDVPFGSIYITDEPNEPNPVCTQGLHSLEAWISVDKNGVKVESEHVTSQVLIILDESKKEKYVILNDLPTEIVNWTEARFFSYAVYNSESNNLPLTFVLTDYNGRETYATYTMGNVAEGAKNIFSTMMEIETAILDFSVKLNIMSEDELLQTIVLGVDNSQNFSPTAGADFIFNPKLRSNQEENPATVINSVTGEEVEATFKGVGFVTDGYTVDENGNQCLRILPGDELHIKGYEAYSDFMGDTHTASLTMEFDFAVRNVTDEEEPVLRMCSYNNGIPVGWEMRALDAMFGTLGNQVRLDQDVAWAENTRTHVAVNIVYNLANSGLNYIRIFVNGKINREMSYLATDTFVQYDESGKKTSGGIRIGSTKAGIDIYGIRIFKKSLASSDVMQDRAAAFPTSAEKMAFREANNILYNGVINYEYAKAKYNTLLWKFNDKQPVTRLATYGDKSKQLQYGDLVVSIIGDKKHSGTMYYVNTQGQGTSSMSYWKWNQRFQFDEDGYFINELGERFPAERWQLMEGMPYSYRNDAKINWASSMQAHKLGATALFHDCWKRIVNKNTIVDTEGGQDFTHTEGGYADCRVSVRQLPFMMFVQKDANSEPEFYALFTFGPGKGDKPTFGYDKSVFPDYTMLEGCDNNKPMVMHRVPWDSYIGGGIDDEKWTYNGEDNWEVSIGSGKLWQEFQAAFNFVYFHHTDIKPYIGTFADLKKDEEVDANSDYWVAYADGQGAAKYDLFRYDIEEKQWVAAGLDRVSFNLATQCQGKYTPSGSDYDAINEGFIAARKALFKDAVGNHFDVQDILFTMMFLRIFAATDNRGKNTYLYKVKAGDKIRSFQDDLDSIKLTDNVGRKTKPYWIEEHDVNPQGQPYWNSSRNALYNLLEEVFATECKAMVASILTAMNELGGGSLEGCLQKYFYDVQEGFPAVAYNEIARLLYEDAAKALADGRYTANTPPLPQCLGDQLQSEKEWDKKRMVFMSSYASYGEFASGEVPGALAFRSILTTSGASPKYSFTVVPHLWLYPANGTGDSVFPSGVRVPSGQSFTFPERTSDGNTNVRIHGINYYREIGNFGDKSVGEAFALSGERLTEFVASAAKPEFRITSMTVSAPNIEKIDLTGIATLKGALDLSKQSRLKEILLSGTELTSVVLPPTDALTILKLPATLTSLRIESQPSLASVTIDGTDSLQTVYIDHSKAKSFDSLNLVQSLYNSYQSTGRVPSSLTLLNVKWTNAPVAVMEWLAEKVPNKNITGSVSIYEPNANTPSVTWTIKNKFLAAFGNVDDATSDDYRGLLLDYAKKPFDASAATISGNFFVDDLKVYDKKYNEVEEFIFSVKPYSQYENTQTKIAYSVEGSGNYTMDADGTFRVRMYELSKVKQTAIIKANVSVFNGGASVVESVSKEIEVWLRPAKVGDLVYYDGTYGDAAKDNDEKTVIGVCCYVAPRKADGSINEKFHNPLDKHVRLMIAVDEMKASSDSEAFSSWQWGAYPGTSNDSLYSTDADGTKKELSLNGTTTIYDVPNLRNLTTRGLSLANGSDTTYITDESLRDNSDLGLENDGFKPISAEYAMGDGFAYNEPLAYQNERKMDDTLLRLAGEGYAKGDMVNSGYAKTLRVIAHRNNIINHCYNGNTINGMSIPMVPVSASGGDSEIDLLAQRITDLRNWAKGTGPGQLGDTQYGNKWSQLYFPAASACHAYEPKVTKSGEVLDAKFRKHNWFLPAEGLLGRLFWYLYRYENSKLTTRDDSPFNEAIRKGKFVIISASRTWSVTELSSSYSWYVSFYDGYTNTYYKNYSMKVRAVSAF